MLTVKPALLFYRPTYSNPPSAGDHTKWCHNSGSECISSPRGPRPLQGDSSHWSGGEITTYQFDIRPSNRMGADIWSDCRPLPTKPHRGQHKESSPQFSATTDLADIRLDSTQAQDINITGTKSCPQ